MSEKLKKPSKPFPIVAIGASTGGPEATLQLFKALPADTGMAYIYIQHPTAGEESLMPEVLGRATHMKVSGAEHLQPVEANQVYLLPAGKNLILIDGVMALTPEPDRTQMPIDHFMVSLAEKQQHGAIGIILSGAHNDGTRGLKAIKRFGGITMVQDETAKFQSMPKSAIAEGVVDMVLPPLQIAKELQRLAKQIDALNEVTIESPESLIPDEDENLLAILAMLKKSNGVDFKHYKSTTIKRRILRRMLLHKLDTIKDYVQYLKQHGSEITQLYHDMLINVTSFFRDPDTLEFLSKTIIPRIVKTKIPNEPIRIWVPACATGEEAFSLAMIFMEVVGDQAGVMPIQIFATDLSEAAIAKARVGIYSRNDVANVSPQRLQRFFSKIDGSYRIIKPIRDLCIFAPHNIFKDPPFSRLDLISCCNLMIYLDTVLQKKILSTFYYGLQPEGYLLLGKSETVTTAANQFAPLEKKYKVYSKKKEAANNTVINTEYRLPKVERNDFFNSRRTNRQVAEQSANLEKTVDHLLLSRYVPATVVVNQDLEILQFKGSTGLYLEPSPGRASLNLLKMARPGLAFDLRNCVHKASKSNTPIKKTGLELQINNVMHHVSIEVVPIKSDSDSEEKLFVVVFENNSIAQATEQGDNLEKESIVRQLEDELRTLKEDMRSIIEEQEASNEELQSANEEIVSSNEELQSINEELETSKEELESTNEELMTTNVELQMRNEQLAEAYEYAESFFEVIREAVVVLDKNLRVKSANRSFYRIFHLRPDEVEGIYIYEVNGRQWDIPRLRDVLEDIVPKNRQAFDVTIKHHFKGLGEKILLLNAYAVAQKVHQQQLILLAIEDITDIKLT